MAETDDPNADSREPDRDSTAAAGDAGTKEPEEAGSGDEELADEWAAALAEQQNEADTATAGRDGAPEQNADQAGTTVNRGSREAGAGGDRKERKHKPDPGAETLQPEQLAAAAEGDGEEMNLEMVLDVPVTMSMEIGRTRIPIRNLLQLNQGSVVELDRLAGEPLDVMVNGTLIAHGEVVVVNEKFGIRLTDVISPSERIRKLK